MIERDLIGFVRIGSQILNDIISNKVSRSEVKFFKSSSTRNNPFEIFPLSLLHAPGWKVPLIYRLIVPRWGNFYLISLDSYHSKFLEIVMDSCCYRGTRYEEFRNFGNGICVHYPYTWKVRRWKDWTIRNDVMLLITSDYTRNALSDR